MPDQQTEALLLDAYEALEALEAWTNDSSDVNRLAAVKDAMPMLTDYLKLVAAAVNTSLRLLLAEGPQFLADGRTALIETEEKRTLRPGSREKIRKRIVQRVASMSEGEGTVASMIEDAVALTEEIYISPSTLPKWGGLKTLGFSSWDEVADVNEQEKGVVIK